MIRVAINAQFQPGKGYGGVESVLTGLVSALADLKDSDVDYVIIGPWQNPDWLAPYVRGRMQIVAGPPPKRANSRAAATSRIRSVFQRVGRLMDSNERQSRWPEVPVSDGFYEGLGCDVIHFPYQAYTVCALPSIYNPHDLQHRHFPQFYRPEHIVQREATYPVGCRLAHTVAVASNWVAGDIAGGYGIDRGKLQVIPWAPPTAAYSVPDSERVRSTKEKYGLAADSFAFYPAMLWPHKNHRRLISAVARLRDRHGLNINLVCTAHKNHLWDDIHERIRECKLQDQVRFLGFVPPDDLRALYALAQFVVIPTLFEAASGPLFEAWMEGTPAACSAVTSLPEQAQDAALLFDPYDIDGIAAAMARMASEPELRAQLRRRGRRRLMDFSWERTAKAYRAVYRRAARQQLTDEDELLLRWDWTRGTQEQAKKVE